jgi:hypothetical protein
MTKWTSENVDYLVERYLSGESVKSNPILANLCSWEFGREVTENGIKGQIDRQRKKGRLPKYRPDYEHAPTRGCHER